MAKPLVLIHEDVELPFFPEKVDRAKIYGYIDVQALDEAGNACSLATLADDGCTVIGRGGTAFAHLDPEGAWLDKKTLKPVDPAGKPITPAPSSFNAPIRLVQQVPVDEYLSHNVKAVYLMQSEADLTALKKVLGGGAIFAFPFSFRGGLEPDVGFLLAGQDGNVFLAVGQPTKLHFIGLEQAAVAADEETVVEEDDDDSLDFGMM